MKNIVKLIIPLIGLMLVLSSCDELTETLNPGKGKSFTGEGFLGGGIYSYNSVRNPEYRFEIDKNNSILDISASFNQGNGRVYVLNSARDVVFNSGSSTEVLLSELRFDYTGTYYIKVTGVLEDYNEYDLTVTGDYSGLTYLKTEEVRMDDQQWATGGGIYSYHSFRNAQYKFTVNEPNTLVDLTVYSEGPNIRLYVMNSARDNIWNSGTSVITYGSSLYFDQPGQYYFAVTTNDAAGSQFDVSVQYPEGTLSGIERIPTTSFAPVCSNLNGGGIYSYDSPNNKRYTFSVSAATSVDFACTSTKNTRVYILNSAGNTITNTGTSINNYINSQGLAPGTYTAVVTCNEPTDYCLNLWSAAGTVSSLK